MFDYVNDAAYRELYAKHVAEQELKNKRQSRINTIKKILRITFHIVLGILMAASAIMVVAVIMYMQHMRDVPDTLRLITILGIPILILFGGIGYFHDRDRDEEK